MADFDDQEKTLEHSSVVGAGLFALLLGVGVFSSGNPLTYLDTKSFCLVAGGTLGAAFLQFSSEEVLTAWKRAYSSITPQRISRVERLQYLLQLGQRVRTHGPLILEDEARRIEDRFLKVGLNLIADGQPGSTVRRILENEMRNTGEQHSRSVRIMQSMAGYAPAMGLIGTLIGLINMLQVLKQPDLVGPAMSLALVATLYGALSSNIFFLPLAGKMKERADEESFLQRMTMEGILSIARQENTLMLEQKLCSYVQVQNGE